MNVIIPGDFTLQELRAFIEGEEVQAPEGYFTAQEWADHFGLNVKAMRLLLVQAKEKGLLDMVRVSKKSLDDKTYYVPTYALIKAEDDERRGTEGTGG